MTTETLTFETLTEKLDAAGIDYAHLDRGSDSEALDIPGYGQVCYDSRPGCEGWFTRTDSDQPIEEARLLSDLDELAEMARRIADAE